MSKMDGFTTDNPPERVEKAKIVWLRKTGGFLVFIGDVKYEFANEEALADGLFNISSKYFIHEKKEYGFCPYTTEWVREDLLENPQFEYGKFKLAYDIPPQSKAPKRRFMHHCPPVHKDKTPDISPSGIKKLEYCVSRTVQTKSLYFNFYCPDCKKKYPYPCSECNCTGSYKPVVGEYNDERKALHEQIIGEIKGKNVCIESNEGQPIAILTGGQPASGKTRYMSQHRDWTDPKKTGRQIFRIDADDIRAMLPEYEGWNASGTHEETRDILFQLLESIGKPCKTDIIYDGTMSNSKKYIELVQKLKALGYFVYIVYMEVKPSVSMKRVKTRYEHQGRYVPLNIVKEVAKEAPETFNLLIGLVDGWVSIDSNPDKDGKPKFEIIGESETKLPHYRPYWSKGVEE